jgi:hypothetical protein
MVQMHKKFIDKHVKEFIERYIAKKVRRKYVQEILGIKKTRLFDLVKQVKEDPEKFSILPDFDTCIRFPAICPFQTPE